ncbi:MAG: MBOAT family protein [Clostridium sp.]|nr:MBOAT family protein [Prevotella sp.]MCM1428176.1 MBOAT family protein [Clostridium sp.]MCM1475907.1 MBOAT family protein [Muribaculaceae bacterium]
MSDFSHQLSIALSNLADMLLYDPSAPMLFSSGLFWLLFIFFLPIFVILRKSRAKIILFIVAFSLYFYYKSSGLFFLMLIATSFIDWSISQLIARSDKRGVRLALMWLSICISVSILGYFKYANFFLWNWNQMVEGNFQPFDIILPVGISFYTFQSISYVVDVYKERIKPTNQWIDYLFYLSFFPALVAGPIVRADYFLPQLEKNEYPTANNIYGGLWLIIIGIVKKAVIADYIAQFNDLIFNSPELYTGVQTLMGVLGYTMQIFCDFSGYSDMAIGLALIMGFKLGVNFNYPYKSRNVQEFWRRWHISLSSWLRDYIYIPLGGNRKGVVRTYVNNFLTMLIGGLWHGAAWKFVFWGAMHGVGLAVHKAVSPILRKIPDNWLTNFLSWALTFIFVSLLWVFFRAADFESSITIIKNIFVDFHWTQFPEFFSARMTWCVMMLCLFIFHFIPESWAEKGEYLFMRSPWVVKLAVFFLAVQLVIEYMSAEVSPFIYFQF